MSSDEQEALHMIGSHRLEQSPFLEAEKSSTDRGEGSADPAVRLIVECSVGVSPGQEGIVLRIKGQTQDFWSQQKQAHIDYQAHLKSTKSEHRK